MIVVSCSLNNITIRQDSEGRYCLNDLHKAAGGEKTHQPSNWLWLGQTQDLIREIDSSCDSRNLAVDVRRNVGTYVCEDLVIDYAAWISPAFRLKVYRVFKQAAMGQVQNTMNTNQIANLTSLTMSSLEIAELTGKEHFIVLRDIRNMMKSLDMQAIHFCMPFRMPSGQTAKVFNLPKDLTLTLVTGYSIPMRHAINKRWLELEGQSKPVAPALPNFSDPIAAARAWADELEGKQKASNQITTFSFQSNAIRTLEVDGQILFVARDVCTVLGYRVSNVALTVSRFCKNAVKACDVLSYQMKDIHPSAYLLPEADLYRLVIHSGTPSAQKFEKWVMEEVLPSIRKTGAYVVGQPSVTTGGDSLSMIMHNSHHV